MNPETVAGPACSLEASALQDRIAWITALNKKFLRQVDRKGPVLVLTYDMAAREQLHELIARERDCCSFLKFELAVVEHAVLTITVPTDAVERADALLTPFAGTTSLEQNPTCCGSCEPPVAERTPLVTKAAAGTAAAALVACSACCVIPLAFPAVAATSAAGLLSWLGREHVWIIVMAVITTGVAWAWVWRRLRLQRRRVSHSTLILMSLSSLAILLALAWPLIEGSLIAALTS